MNDGADADVVGDRHPLAVDEQVEVLVRVQDLALLGERRQADRAQALLQRLDVLVPRRRRLQDARQLVHRAERRAQLGAAAVVAVVAVGSRGSVGVAAARQRERGDGQQHGTGAEGASHRQITAHPERGSRNGLMCRPAMNDADALEPLSSKELHDLAVHYALRHLDVGFYLRLMQALPVAEAAAGQVNEAEADVVHPPRAHRRRHGRRSRRGRRTAAAVLSRVPRERGVTPA